MALRSYKKAPIRRKTPSYSRYVPEKSRVVLEIQKDPLTVSKLFSGFKNDIQNVLTSSRFLGAIVPAAFIIYGANLLLGQVTPTLAQYINEQTGGLEQNITSVVPADHVAATQNFLSNPGSAYFEQIQNSAKQARVLEQDPVGNAFQGTFSLSIPDLGLDGLNVQANTQSGVEAIYDKVLENGLAHMESTGLPISEVTNNIVIYGHSAPGDYFDRTNDPAAAFSKLTDIKLGDEIEITIQGETHKYRVSKTKIVKPNDLSIIAGQGNPNVQTLTLFTCYPLGNNANRYVVTANPI